MKWASIFAISTVFIIRSAASFTEHEASFNGDALEKKPSVAIVTGYIGIGPAFVPTLPHPVHHCYFITNNIELGTFATGSNWKVIYLENLPVVDSLFDVESDRLNSAHAKPLKVYPQRFLPKTYDFIIWFDNKYQLLTDVVLNSIYHWNPAVAMMLPPRPECCGADLEFVAAMMQPRYMVDRERIESYMQEQGALGYPIHGARHMRTGFVVYNMNHADTLLIQDTWQEHINRVGIMCQIAFYFVAQRFPDSIQQYDLEWNTGSRYGFVYYDGNANGNTNTA